MNTYLGIKGQCFVCMTGKGCLLNITPEEHHVIPREYGGEKGPVVSLCPNQHRAIHRTANAFIKQKDFSVIQQFSTEASYKQLFSESQRFGYLVSLILKGFLNTNSDPNKLIIFQAKIPQSVYNLLDDIRSATGKRTNEEVLTLLIKFAKANLK